MIIKIQKREDPYSRIDNRCLSDERLSYRARGLLAYLLSKPDSWQVRSGEIVARGTEGRDAIRAAFKELAEFGYAHLQKSQANGRLQGSEWVVSELSNRAPEKPSPENPLHRAPEKPTVGKPVSLVTKEKSSNERGEKKQLSRFIDFLIEDPRFDGLDVEAEVARAVEWYKKKNRRVTERLLENWLLHAEQPLEEDEDEVGSLACDDYFSWEGWTEERRRALLELWPNAAEPPQRWDKISPDIKEQIEARVKEGWA